MACAEMSRANGRAVLEFSVTDSGIGIAQEDIGLLFKPFSQTDSSTTREYGGSGLGLSIVRNLALAMGGDVGVSSQAGQGSAFWFQVRVKRVADAQDSRQASRPGPVQADAPPGAFSGHVLVAEDNAVNAMVIESLLGKLGVTMTLATDGQQAVNAVAQADAAQFDLVLMDLHMPVLDGYGATQKIRQWEAANGRPRLPIIALTADAFEEDRQHCLAAGMDDFLSKPIALEALTLALGKCLPGARASQTHLPPTPPALRPLDAPAFAAMVDGLTPLLQQNKYAAMGRFKQLQALVAGTAIAADVDALAPELSEMRFDLVLRRLLEIAGKLSDKEL
jgi:CheY-like chemotaxis protein